MKRKFGFTLVEVILASVVIAGFMATTVFTAGEISLARREALATTDRNTWANLQTQFAAEGVKAPSDNANVWGSSAGEFGVIHAQGGSLDFTSTAEDLPATTVATLGATGKSVSTSPFLLGLSAIAQRQNLHTTGLSLMDRQSYRGITTSGVPNGNAVHEETMEKPDSLFGFSTSLAVAYYDLTQGKWIVSPAQATLDALTQIDWTRDNAFYILAKATTGTISDMDCTLVGVGDLSEEATPPFTTDYSKVYAVSFSSLQYYPGTSLTITSVSNDADGNVSYGRAGVTITPVTPYLVLDRVKNTATDTPVTTSDVTIADVAHRPLYGETSYNLFRARLSYVNDATHDLAWVRTNIPQILTHISIYRYFDSLTSSSQGPDTLSAATGYTTFAANPGYFASGISSKARIQNWDDSSLIRPYSALIGKASVVMDLNVIQSDLPRITFNPTAGTYPPPVSVKMTASTPILASSANEKDASGVSIYYINYTTNGSSPTASSDHVDSAGLIPTPITATTTVKAQALSYSGNQYSPFLKDSLADSAAYTIRDDDEKERTTVMKVRYISETLNGHVQGSIQLLEDDSFTSNGSATLGLKLYVRYEPIIESRDGCVYHKEQASYKKGECSIVGASYEIPSPNPWEGTKTITSTASAPIKSGEKLLINSFPPNFTYVIIADSTTSVPIEKPVSNSAKSGNTYNVKKGTASTTYTWDMDNEAKNNTHFNENNVYTNTPESQRESSVTMPAGTHNCSINLDRGAVLYLEPGIHEFYSLHVSDGAKVLPTGAGVIIHLTSGQQRFQIEGNPTVTTNADGSFSSASGGGIVGNKENPVVIHLDSTTASDDTIKGQIFGKIYSNGFVRLDSCLVYGRVECDQIQTNDNTYLFIQE